jgi:hypothetical protein
MIDGIDGLRRDIEFAFGLPVVGYVLMLLHTKSYPSSKWIGLQQRLSLAFLLLLFGFLLCGLLYQDRSVLIALWRSSPVASSVAYATSVLSILAGLGGLIFWKLRPELWNRQ